MAVCGAARLCAAAACGVLLLLLLLLRAGERAVELRGGARAGGRGGPAAGGVSQARAGEEE